MALQIFAPFEIPFKTLRVKIILFTHFFPRGHRLKKASQDTKTAPHRIWRYEFLEIVDRNAFDLGGLVQESRISDTCTSRLNTRPRRLKDRQVNTKMARQFSETEIGRRESEDVLSAKYVQKNDLTERNRVYKSLPFQLKTMEELDSFFDCVSFDWVSVSRGRDLLLSK